MTSHFFKLWFEDSHLLFAHIFRLTDTPLAPADLRSRQRVVARDYTILSRAIRQPSVWEHI